MDKPVPSLEEVFKDMSITHPEDTCLGGLICDCLESMESRLGYIRREPNLSDSAKEDLDMIFVVLDYLVDRTRDIADEREEMKEPDLT